MRLYLIKRQPRPEWHKAPYHPVIICDRKPMAEWEMGHSGEHAYVWMKPNDISTGWLLVRWNGLDIDYGHVVRSIEMPDGSHAAFFHARDQEPWSLMAGATWWSNRVMPSWLVERNVVYPKDQHSQQSILDTLANDGASGFGRKIPDHWPTPWPSLEATS